MNLLLDTQAFLWWSLEPERLPRTLIEALSNVGNRIFLSAASSWEVQIKAGLGKLLLEEPLRTIVERELEQNGWEPLPVRMTHTWKLAELPLLQGDFFDRLLVAQALVEGLTLVTKDPQISAYPGLDVFWG